MPNYNLDRMVNDFMKQRAQRKSKKTQSEDEYYAFDEADYDYFYRLK